MRLLHLGDFGRSPIPELGGPPWYNLQRIDFVVRVAAAEFLGAKPGGRSAARLVGQLDRAVFPVMA
jgi:hypothetical protein